MPAPIHFRPLSPRPSGPSDGGRARYNQSSHAGSASIDGEQDSKKTAERGITLGRGDQGSDEDVSEDEQIARLLFPQAWPELADAAQEARTQPGTQPHLGTQPCTDPGTLAQPTGKWSVLSSNESARRDGNESARRDGNESARRDANESARRDANESARRDGKAPDESSGHQAQGASQAPDNTKQQNILEVERVASGGLQHGSMRLTYGWATQEGAYIGMP